MKPSYYEIVEFRNYDKDKVNIGAVVFRTESKEEAEAEKERLQVNSWYRGERNTLYKITQTKPTKELNDYLEDYF